MSSVGGVAHAKVTGSTGKGFAYVRSGVTELPSVTVIAGTGVEDAAASAVLAILERSSVDALLLAIAGANV
jgi:hypothetical protein